jgi:ubiquitin-protein ligase
VNIFDMRIFEVKVLAIQYHKKMKKYKHITMYLYDIIQNTMSLINILNGYTNQVVTFHVVNESSISTQVDCPNYTKITIEHPSHNKPYYFIRLDNNDMWIHYVNLISSMSKLTLDQICKLIAVNVLEQLKTNNLTSHYDMERRIMQDPCKNEYLKREFMNTYSCMEKDKYDINIVDNITTWKIECRNFKNTKLNTSVILTLVFNPTEYPDSPPCITSVVPPMANSLHMRIMSISTLKKTCWSRTRSMRNILRKIYDILEERGNTVACSYFDDKICPLVDNIAQLSGVVNIRDFNDEKKSSPKDTQTTLPIKTSSKHVNSSGVGYNCSTKWNITTYLEEQIEKRKQLTVCVGVLHTNLLQKISLVETDAEKKNNLFEYIITSELIPSICNILGDMTPITWNDSELLYTTLFEIIKMIPDKYYGEYIKNETSYAVLHKCLRQCIKQRENAKLRGDARDFGLQNIMEVISRAHSMDMQLNIGATQAVSCQNLDAVYVENMEKYRFSEADILSFGYYYNSQIKNITLQPTAIRRLTCEFASLANDLPINKTSSIFVKVDPTNMSVIRAMIIGPKDTPYENGCFIFDIQIPSTYPNAHPYIQFMNHGGVRFNPNLYSCGKVCLSLIGTWGDSDKTNSENWQPATSTIFQLLMSIQSQILVENPYANEPGYYGTSQNAKESIEYNKNIQYYTLRYAITDLLNEPHKRYGDFGDIILQHFKHNQTEVKNKYANLDKDQGSVVYKTCVQRLETLK